MRDICKIALRLTILMVIAGLCLGAAYTVTKDPIARQEAEQKEMARKAVLEEAVSFEEVQLTDGGNVQECYRGLDAAGNPCGYAMSVTAKGFGGDIQLTVGVKDGVVTGVRIGTHSETPGLGARAAEEKFYSQFTGKSGTLSVIKTGEAGDSEINAITAATIASTAVTNAVNEALDCAAGLN